MTAPSQLARKAIAMPVAVAFLALAPAGAWGVADVIKNSGNSFDKSTYYSDEGDLVRFEHTGGAPHNVTSTQFSGGERLFSSATIKSGSTAVNGTESLSPATYPFICTIHDNMAAELVVRETGAPPPEDGAPPPEDGAPPPEDGAPPNEFSFGKVKKNKRKGTAKLTVKVPGSGELGLAKTKKVKADDESAEDAGKEELSIKPKGKAKKKLNSKGKAKVKANVTFTPTGGTPNTEDKRIKLVKR